MADCAAARAAEERSAAASTARNLSVGGLQRILTKFVSEDERGATRESPAPFSVYLILSYLCSTAEEPYDTELQTLSDQRRAAPNPDTRTPRDCTT